MKRLFGRQKSDSPKVPTHREPLPLFPRVSIPSPPPPLTRELPLPLFPRVSTPSPPPRLTRELTSNEREKANTDFIPSTSTDSPPYYRRSTSPAPTGIPIEFYEILQLTSLEVQLTSITQRTLTLESDHFILVREEVNGQNQAVIIDLTEDNHVLRLPIPFSAESAIMHPTQKNIIALRAGRTLQIFNFDTKEKVKSHVNDADVVFWKWVSDTTIGMVTESSVFHWTIADQISPPQKIFDRHPILVDAQIINYRATPDEKWLVLVGISGNTDPFGFEIKGSMQLYSRERGISQSIDGHAAVFAQIKQDGHQKPTKLFIFAVRTAIGAKLYVVEMDHTSPDPPFKKKAVDVYFPPEATGDFPVALQVSKKHGIIYLVTKYGFLHLFDLESGECIYMNRISRQTIFVTTEREATGGILLVDEMGQVLSVNVDEQTIIPYLLTVLHNTELALKLASRANLTGVDDLYVQQYNKLFQNRQYTEAAKTAANSPRGILRTGQVIEALKAAPAPPGGLSPILAYFGILLEKGLLNHLESLELARPVLQQGRKHLLEKWIKEDKFTCSEELGDFVRLHDMNLALSVYLRAETSNKVIACFAETGQTEEIVLYSKKVGYNPDYYALLQHVMRTNPEKGAEFAAQLVNDETGPLVDIERVVDVFMSQNMIQPATSFLFDALKDNRPEQGPLQTRLLEMNLVRAQTHVADAILRNEMFTHYDRPRIAKLCEKAGLLQRAADIKRAIVHAAALQDSNSDPIPPHTLEPPEWSRVLNEDLPQIPVDTSLDDNPPVLQDPVPDGMGLIDLFLQNQAQRAALLEQGLDAGDLRDALRACEQRICTSLLAVLDFRDAKHTVTLLKSARAQSFLDAVQAVLDRGSLPSAERTSQARRLIIRLSEVCDQLPTSLFITGVADHDEHPTFSGGFADIYRASFHGTTVALKRIRMFHVGADSSRIRLQFCREALVWQTLRHPYVLPLIGIDRETFPSSFCMVSPWMQHGTILKYLSEHGRANVEKMLLQIAEGLGYLHSMNIVHGDLRGTNILISDDWNVCLADFGLTHIIEDTTSTTNGALRSSTNRAGSPRWFAPELLAPTLFGCDRFVRTPASDVYAFACVCFELHTGHPPFSEISLEIAAMLRVVAGERPGRPPAMSDHLWDLISAGWAQKFADRPDITKIIESMRVDD